VHRRKLMVKVVDIHPNIVGESDRAGVVLK
jgi:hypothetical protein